MGKRLQRVAQVASHAAIGLVGFVVGAIAILVMLVPGLSESLVAVLGIVSGCATLMVIGYLGFASLAARTAARLRDSGVRDLVETLARLVERDEDPEPLLAALILAPSAAILRRVRSGH